LAAVYLGFRRSRGIALAALFLTLAERLCTGAQKYNALPATALTGIPALLALALYAAASRRR
jgi:ABC-type uncharacterized transport system permease subunit